jgi:predicted dehydrogenase
MKSSPATTTHPVPLLASIRRAAAAALAALVLVAAASAQQPAAPIKVGIVGLDAHAVTWTQIIQGVGGKPPIADLRIVAAVPAPSADVPFSIDNIEKNTARMRELGVEISGTIEELLAKVDAVMILSIDGRPHPEQARPVFAARKPVFIDKPVAASLVEIVEIFRAAQESGTPCFSNSALRYGPTAVALANDSKLGVVLGADSYSNSKSILPGHPDLFYYGVHGCELLFRLMGPGCNMVSRTKSPTADLVVGVWNDGRIGTFRGILQGSPGFGANVFCEKGIVNVNKFEGYEPLLTEIVKFFRTGTPPMSVEQTLEVYAFMEAADYSLKQGGAAVSVTEILAKAQSVVDARQKKK